MITATYTAYILNIKPVTEKQLLLDLFTLESGRLGVFISVGLFKKNHVQLGGRLVVSVKARLEHYAFTVTDIQDSSYYHLLYIKSNAIKLQGLLCLLYLLRSVLPEKMPKPALFLLVETFTQDSELAVLAWLRGYLWLEIRLLEVAGYGLNLSECALDSTCNEPLALLSPLSGKACCEKHGGNYRHKLLPLPLLKEDKTIADFIECFKLMNFFIEKRILTQYQEKDFLELREVLLNRLGEVV